MAILSFFCIIVPRFYRTKSQVISSKNEGLTLILPIENEIKIRENRRHTLIFDQNDLTFFV